MNKKDILKSMDELEELHNQKDERYKRIINSLKRQLRIAEYLILSMGIVLIIISIGVILK